MLYTRKGDGGTTKVFGRSKRLAKSSAITEALGALDEINSLLGVCKMKAALGSSASKWKPSFQVSKIIAGAQQNLFIIQAETAGAKKKIIKAKVVELEKTIDAIEKKLPPLKSFVIPGGTERAALLDYARAVSRRAERRVIGARNEEKLKISASSLAYLNRLSSLLYALARLANHESGIKEEAPTYA